MAIKFKLENYFLCEIYLHVHCSCKSLRCVSDCQYLMSEVSCTHHTLDFSEQ